MKQIARKDLTLLDRLELAKKSTFEIKKIRFDYVYAVKAIFKDENKESKFIKIQLNKDQLRYALPLLESRSFIPKDVFPTFEMASSLLLKNLFYYKKGCKPVWVNVHYMHQFRQAVLNTETTYSVFAYRLLCAIKDFIQNEMKIGKHMKKPLV